LAAKTVCEDGDEEDNQPGTKPVRRVDESLRIDDGDRDQKAHEGRHQFLGF
jgi:hypothetical protein